jgi:hypothetical protein
MARYEDTIILRDNNKKRYLSTETYPVFPKRDTDVYIVGTYGQRMDNLANQYYGSPNLWWVIARANPELFNGGIHLKPGKEYRIPTDLSTTGEEFVTGGGQIGNVSGT